VRGQDDLHVITRFGNGRYNRVCRFGRRITTSRNRQVDRVAFLALDVEAPDERGKDEIRFLACENLIRPYLGYETGAIRIRQDDV
jgi:hypothetical protein